MADKRTNIVLRFGIVYIAMSILFVLVIAKIISIQTQEREKLLELADRQKISDIQVRPKRGNIYASDGRLLASSIPTYHVFMDTRVPALRQNDGQLFKDNIDSLSIALAAFFGDRSAAEYKRMIVKGYEERRGELRIYPHRISYSQLKELRTLPLFRMGRNRSGLITKEFVRRVKPFGSLASRTIGDVYADEVKGGRSGIEGSFNEDLVGIPGISIRQKVANRYIETPEVPPVNGLDVYSTLDIEIQDIAEKALRDTIAQLGAEAGSIVVMETKTGKIRAIVNLELNHATGTYFEGRNIALSDRIEPGSTFKIAALMAVLDEGKVKLTDTFDTKNGRMQVANRIMRDHNHERGGYGKLTVEEIIQASSNVGTTMMVQKTFGDRPSAFVEKLYDYGLNDSLELQMRGIARPWIKHPKNQREWYRTSMAWMSIGYETIIPPIYMLTYYNAIANNGTMLKPLFVSEIRRDDELVKQYEPVVLREQICKPSTLEDVRQAMLGVVEGKHATARTVKSKIVRIAGKTGTAQVSQGSAGYRTGQTRHNVSFAGFFPYEDPQYTCIVFINAPKGLPSGGRMAGAIFKKVAEGIMLLKTNRDPEAIAQEVEPFRPCGLPEVKPGSSKAIHTLAHELMIPVKGDVRGWASTETREGESVRLETYSVQKGIVPDVRGMGARDAFFVLGNLGLDVKINGRGKVISQSLKPGSQIVEDAVIELKME